jgi:HEPN domain-containing protein
MSEKSLEWLKFAKDDLLVAKKLLRPPDIFPGVAAYHAQQSAEKALKAYLMYCGQDILKSHNLLILMQACAQFDLEFLIIESMASCLNPFSVKTRYPDDVSFCLLKKDAKILINYAAVIFELVDKKMQK